MNCCVQQTLLLSLTGAPVQAGGFTPCEKQEEVSAQRLDPTLNYVEIKQETDVSISPHPVELTDQMKE